MPTTNPYFDRLADIQAHLLNGGFVEIPPYARDNRYAKADLALFSADSQGLYLGYGPARVCLNGTTMRLTRYYR